MRIYLIIMVILTFLLRQENDTPSVLIAYFNGTANHSNVKLLKKLDEISGLAISGDGRLFCHDDESGAIYQLDKESGNIIKTFYIGKKNGRREDFEGLAIVGETFYLITSDGYLFEFPEGADDAHVDYKKYKTGLSEDFDIEGLCYDPETRALLLACKDSPKKGNEQPRADFQLFT